MKKNIFFSSDFFFFDGFVFGFILPLATSGWVVFFFARLLQCGGGGVLIVIVMLGRSRVIMPQGGW